MMEDFSDVLQKDIEVETVETAEFEFEDFSLVRVNNHWELQFEDNEGAESIIVQPEDFVDNKLLFLIDEKEKVFLKEDFDRIEKFYSESHLV